MTYINISKYTNTNIYTSNTVTWIYTDILTFDLQVNMILRDTEVISGHAGVFDTVSALSRGNLQSSIVVLNVRFSLQNAEAAVFKPESQEERWGGNALSFQTYLIFFLKKKKKSIHSPCNFRDGWAKERAVNHGPVISDDLVDFVGRRQHSGRLGCSEAAEITGMLLGSRRSMENISEMQTEEGTRTHTGRWRKRWTGGNRVRWRRCTDRQR